MTSPRQRGFEPHPLLDIEAVASRLGVSVRHVRRLVAERRIPYVKWGRLLRFDAAQIEAWVDEARVGGTLGLSRGHAPATRSLPTRR
jgi:excisionase family DNA binding protein